MSSSSFSEITDLAKLNSTMSPTVGTDSPFVTVINSTLRVTRFDQLSSWLVSMILVSTVIVAVLLTIWASLGNQEMRRLATPIPIPTSDLDDTDTDQSLIDSDLAAPDVPVVGEAVEFETTISLVGQAVKSSLENGTGTGDFGIKKGKVKRKTGPEPGGHVQRWRLNIVAADINEYARQIDSLNIQMGVIALDRNQIDLISNVAGAGKIVNSDRKSQGKILRFSENTPALKRWNRAICNKFSNEKSVVRSGAKFGVGLFFDQELQGRLASIEATYLEKQGVSVDDVRKTVFTIENVGNDFDLRIKEIETKNATQ